MNEIVGGTLRKTPLFASLTDKEIEALAGRASNMRFERGAQLFSEGDSCKGLFLVASGKIRIFKLSAAGREQVLAVEGPGSSFAELPVFDGGNYPASGSALEEGVKRYMQGGHPDRLLDPLMRTPQGFRKASWDESLNFTVARLKEIQEKYGKDSVAVYGGASLISEKSYLLGKFARVALGTRHIAYNGRLCMVSAGTAYKLAFGVDRSPLPWSDILKAQVVLVAGANVAECAPITTDYLWRCRDAGGKLIIVDPRMTPICRNADMYLPVRPGTDMALYMGLLHVILRDGLERRDFISKYTTGFEQVAESVRAWDPRTAGEKNRSTARSH